MSVTSILQIFAGVGILVYGIIIMGESLQVIAGDRLRKLTGSLTGTPIKGLLVGTVVTGILQSSSATTVMVVSFVDAGFMTLTQAIGVILGANIGTTVTAQLIAFKITNIAYLCAIIGAGICILSTRKRNKQVGIGLLGFGLLFIGKTIVLLLALGIFIYFLSKISTIMLWGFIAGLFMLPVSILLFTIYSAVKQK